MVAASSLMLLSALLHARPSLVYARHHDALEPDVHAARRRGPQIFNAVHNAMRQWGSSVHHNGMSIFLATVPEGVLFHHGSHSRDSPSEPDWLAYEIEHAELFAYSSPNGPPKHTQPPVTDQDQIPLGRLHTDAPSREDNGWLHVYRTARPLQYLYVDGMGGAKTTMGTLDTQDFLLRGDRTYSTGEQLFSSTGGGPMDERLRAVQLCELCREWRLQGVIRMEGGFEIIQCNFTDGLQHFQTLQRPSSRKINRFEYVRGVAERYFGVGSSRTIIDYSSMVSAFFFPVNLTNPNIQRQDLPRLSNTTESELASIKEYTKQIFMQRRNEPLRTISWRDISDLIVSRYADRLQYMVEKAPSIDVMTSEVNFLLDVYIDYSSGSEPGRTAAAIERCTDFFLGAISPNTDIDHLIQVAFKSVTSKICTTLFTVRDLLAATDSGGSSTLNEVMKELQSLMVFLNWARFKHCRGCTVDEVCLIPMWPFGSEEDYFHPRCTNASGLSRGNSYSDDRRRPLLDMDGHALEVTSAP
ncbi:hypothetical protein QQS21_009578 [Conoideocrella luteorostrata]|uniref:Uncharacterized protein n=1 Tax=Conoideocrella luteorostrata TaxID=1105319 RepID=A0AAJ0CGZ6_9HYPO|nr:hypothetical protein QQS21_009578 [Conoideocrella luteorostrata]